MTALVVVAVVLLVLAAAVVASDRLVANLAERKAAAYLTEPLGADARITVHDRPFLTQAVRGRYERVEVSGSGLHFGAFDGVVVRADLINAYLPLRDLLGHRTRELPVEHVHGHLVLPYDQLARVSRVPGLTLTFRNGTVQAGAALPLPGLSQLGQVRGEAVATLGEGGAVWLRVYNVAVAGITMPSRVLSQLVPALSFPIPLPPLPYGLRIAALVPTPDGLRVEGSAAAAVFRRPVE